MIDKHVIISSDNILRQLLSGILRKAKIDFTDLYGIDESIKDQKNSIFFIDLGDDLYKAEIIWENSVTYGIAKNAIFIIDNTNQFKNTISQHIEDWQILTKPIIPEKILNSIESIYQKTPEILEKNSNDSSKNANDEENNASLNSREDFMRYAIELSFKKMREEHTAPFAAIIVKNNKIIAEGWSQVIEEHDPTAHAEIVALRKAGKVLEYHKFKDCEIYTTTEPCPMCLAALYLAGIEKIYYANSQADAKEFGFGTENIYDEIAMPRDKRFMPYIKILEDEAIYALEEWQRDFCEDGYNIVK